MHFSVSGIGYCDLDVEINQDRTEFRISHESSYCSVILNREQAQRLVNELQLEINRGKNQSRTI